jgi:hypothetical protein
VGVGVGAETGTAGVGATLEGITTATGVDVPRRIGPGVLVKAGVVIEACVVLETCVVDLAVRGVAAFAIAVGLSTDEAHELGVCAAGPHEGGVSRSSPDFTADAAKDVGV